MNETQKWAIVELMGHQKIAGRYSEHGGMHRIDVPETLDGAEPGEFRFTRLYSPQAIYSITFVDEEAARLAARSFDSPAITVWEVQREIKRLAAPVEPGGVVEAMEQEMEDFDFVDDDDWG